MVPLKTRILLADDHAMVRRGLRMVLDAEPDLEVVDEASDGAEALDRVLQGDVDLAIIDVTMPRMTGLQAARELNRRGSDAKVLVLSMHDNEQYLFEAIRVGASGYVLKSAVDRDLVEACRAAMRGEPFLYPGGVRALMREYIERARAGEATSGEMLTPRERIVLAQIVRGASSKEAARWLDVSPRTIEFHRANIMQKLGAKNVADLVRIVVGNTERTGQES